MRTCPRFVVLFRRLLDLLGNQVARIDPADEKGDEDQNDSDHNHENDDPTDDVATGGEEAI